MAETRILSLIEPIFKNDPDATAIIGTDGQTFTYNQINQTVCAMSEFLSSRGVKTNQRIAVINPNGLAMAITYLAISNVASFVPLSHDYSEQQYRYYFEILKTEILVISKEYDESLQKIVEDMNMTVFYVQEHKPNNEIIYQLTGGEIDKNPSAILAKDDDIAIIGFTSGTTSYPKIVPRSHKNIYFSTKKRMQEMNLTPEDRILSTSPVYRGISLNDTLAILASGGSLVYTERLDPKKFVSLLEESSPTWLLGSPVVFNALVDYYETQKIKNINSSLHSIRSSGAPLSQELAKRMRDIFNLPIYIAYGLTETGNIASSQNSPKGPKPGSVGVPINIELSIMDESGEQLDRNNIGEVAVRGPQVIVSYDNDEQVNKESFHEDWFRTGDAGYLDDDGYLFITGRFKEIINRGGEKVSPYEIEAAIAKHPDVLQCAVFPVTGPGGTEDVGAAVVLREGSNLYLKDLRRFLNGIIVAFKMPTSLYVMKEIPVSDADKVQRKTLYEKIKVSGIAPQPEADENEIIILPRNKTEVTLYKIFKKILPVKEISVTDTFFELGGDSLRVVFLFEQIQKSFGIQIPFSQIFNNGSIQKLAEYILNDHFKKELHPFVVPFQEEGSKTPIFFVHAADGEPTICLNVANNFDPERPFYGINFNPKAVKWIHPITFEQIAEHYIKDIRSIQPEGPYIIAGHCLGGILAYEMAQQLIKAGQEIALLTLFDPIIAGIRQKRNLEPQSLRTRARKIKIYLTINGSIFIYRNTPNFIRPLVARILYKEGLLRYSRRKYIINKYSGEIVYFKPEDFTSTTIASIEQWSQLVGSIKVITLKGDHGSMFVEENAGYTRTELNNLLNLIIEH